MNTFSGWEPINIEKNMVIENAAKFDYTLSNYIA